MQFGILAPDTPISTRRQQNLGLAAAVRHFNDRAVPGIGGMWFPMPILWSVLAVSIAEELGIPALAVGNAIEARVMKQVVKVKNDRRVRGTEKLKGLDDWSFANLKRRGTYVVQPIRMAMVQPLVELGFVQGSRYGAFRIHTAGHAMLKLPEIAQCHDLLLKWAKGASPQGLDAALELLSPAEPLLKSARNLIYARLVEGGGEGMKGMKGREGGAIWWHWERAQMRKTLGRQSDWNFWMINIRSTCAQGWHLSICEMPR